MPKPGKRVEFQLRFWFICAGLMLVIFIPIFRGQNMQAAQQQEQLIQLQEEAYTEALRGDRLREQIRTAGTAGFREREARRRYGYVRPGVIRFVAEEASLTYADVPMDPEEELDKDWTNFGN